MGQERASERKRPGRSEDVADFSLPLPASAEVARFEIAGEEYALFSFPLPEPELPDGLTPAEQEVVRGVARGASNAEIATLRGVSANTIANQLRAVYAKLGIRNRNELVSRCFGAPRERRRSP
jgi:DNA-binding CsgD family transcriptional regulator